MFDVIPIFTELQSRICIHANFISFLLDPKSMIKSLAVVLIKRIQFGFSWLQKELKVLHVR
jgi:hypothetical protein